MSCVTANLALQLQSLLFSRLCKFSLKRILLPTITFLFLFMTTLALSQGSPFPSLVKSNGVNLMLLTFRTIRSDFLWNIHFNHDQLCLKKTHRLLYFFNNSLSNQQIERTFYCKKKKQVSFVGITDKHLYCITKITFGNAKHCTISHN